MRSFARWMAGAAVAAVAAGCGGDGGEGGISPTGPLLVGSTASVEVDCPDQMEKGTSGTCNAFGEDSAGTYTNSNESSWSSSNTSVATITSTGAISAVGEGTAAISAVIDGVTGSTTVTVVAPPLTVSISGPSNVKPDTRCEWLASVSGGTAPYTADWSGGTSIYEDESMYLAWTSSSNYSVTVQITDAAGRTASDSHSVNVSSNAPACIL